MQCPVDQNDFKTAAACATQCTMFVPDDENEWVADELRSCFNCLKRRWIPGGMSCQEKGVSRG